MCPEGGAGFSNAKTGKWSECTHTHRGERQEGVFDK